MRSIRSLLRATDARLLVLLAWVLLLAAWVFTNPPFAAPDEAAHYTRALGISSGHLIGTRDPSAQIGANAVQIRWTQQATRVVRLPGGLDPQPFTCAEGFGQLSAQCLNAARVDPAAVELATPVGNYPPLPYLFPAAVMRAGGTPISALRLGRVASAVPALLLLGVALFALFDATAPLLSIAGLLLSVTPMTLFCSASLTGSGLEIAAATAFFAVLLRVLRDGGGTRRWWLALAACGSILALSRPASPVWLGLLLLCGGLWAGRNAIASAAGRRTVRVRAALVGSALAVSIVLSRIWEGTYGSHVSADTSALGHGLAGGVHEWWRALPELVGKFGYINVKLPVLLPVLWGLVLLLLAGAAARGGHRQAVGITALILTAAVGPVVFYALFTRPTGFGLQGRQLLPPLIAIPLLAGEACYARRSHLSELFGPRTLLLVPLAVAGVQVLAWYVNAKRFAVGAHGPAWFVGSAQWTPPGSWVLWLLAVLLAGGCLAALGAVSPRRATP